MLYFYKNFNILLRGMRPLFSRNFFYLLWALGLGLEPALSGAAHDKTWRWAGKWSLKRIILVFTTYSTICGWWRAELLSQWAGPTWCNDEYTRHFCFHITLTLWTPHDSFFLAQLYVWWIKFTLERSQLFQIFHFW